MTYVHVQRTHNTRSLAVLEIACDVYTSYSIVQLLQLRFGFWLWRENSLETSSIRGEAMNFESHEKPTSPVRATYKYISNYYNNKA